MHSSSVSEFFTRSSFHSQVHIGKEGAEGEESYLEFETGYSTIQAYRIGAGTHQTDVPQLRKAHLASDFITYRILQDIFRTNSKGDIDLWPVFEKEILPFCASTIIPDLHHRWLELRLANPKVFADTIFAKGAARTKIYNEFREQLTLFDKGLAECIQTIQTEAQKFYDEHFAAGNAHELEFRLAPTPCHFDPKVDPSTFTEPALHFAFRLGSKKNAPLRFLNEAKLTQVALSIRFGATLANLQQASIKLLVLDDILVSLDMGNRMKVVEILQSESFSGYQQIIMTHDRGLFNEVKRQIQNNEDWSFVTLSGNPQDGITAKPEKRPLEKAKAYFDDNQLDEAAQHLRIAAEENVKSYRQMVLNHNVAEGFTPLSSHIKAVRSHFDARLLQKCSLAISGDRPFSFSERDKQDAEVIRVFSELGKMTERVLNPAAHWNEVPLYEKEVEQTLELIKQLEALRDTDV